MMLISISKVKSFFMRMNVIGSFTYPDSYLYLNLSKFFKLR